METAHYVPPIVWRVCVRKTPYTSRREARLAAWIIRATQHARVSLYRCPFGDGHYHIGKKTRWHE